MSTQNMEEFYDDIFDTWMQNFIDSVPLVSSDRRHQFGTGREPSVNESVINNMFNVRRNLQYNSFSTSRAGRGVNRAVIPNNASVTMQNGRISNHQNMTTDMLDILRTIFNPDGLVNQSAPFPYGSNYVSSNRQHTDRTTTTTTSTTTRINGRTTHSHTSTTHLRHHDPDSASTHEQTSNGEGDTELTEMLSNMTSNIFSSLFGGRAVWLDELNNPDNGVPMEDVKVTLTTEQFDKLGRVQADKCIGQTCNVCMEEFQTSDDSPIKLACSHLFHKDCIKPWLCNEKVTCPVCRADVRDSLNTKMKSM